MGQRVNAHKINSAIIDDNTFNYYHALFYSADDSTDAHRRKYEAVCDLQMDGAS